MRSIAMGRSRSPVSSVLWTLLFLVALVGAAFPWLTDRWNEWSTTLQDEAANVAPVVPGVAVLGDSSSLLIVVEDSEGAAASIVLGSVAEDGKPVFVIIPNSIFTLLPGFGEFRISETTRFEDEQLTRVTVENFLGARIDNVLVLRPGVVAAALASPVEVDVSSALSLRDDSGSSRVVFDAGPQTLDGSQVETLLLIRGEGDLLAWTERQSSAWEAILAEVRRRPGVAEALAGVGVKAEVLVALAQEPRVVLVPAVPVATGSAGEGFTLSGADAEDFVTSRIPSLKLFDEPRPRVELLNGNGQIQATRSVAEALIRNGFRVVRTDNADNFDFEKTVVVAQGRSQQRSAEAVARILAVSEVLLELDTPSGVVDISIIVGQDIDSGEG
jgi:LytR cell envelope-related transcriptional attenuator